MGDPGYLSATAEGDTLNSATEARLSLPLTASGANRPTAAALLRSRLAKTGEIIVCPGVYDGLTARIAVQAGFDCLYMVRGVLYTAVLSGS